MASIAVEPVATTHPVCRLRDHPRGLFVLAGTELWDRVSFHGMLALLILYMAEQLLLPGHVEKIAGFAPFRSAIEAITGPFSTEALAAQIFGLYVGLAYVSPLVGGWCGDRLTGRRREPDEIAKLAIGCAIFAASMAWLAAGQIVARPSGKVPFAWDCGFHLIECYGYLHVRPVAIGLFARGAPAPVNARMLSIHFLSIFAGSTISGRLGGLHETLSPAHFWLMHAAVVGAGGVFLVALGGPLRRRLCTPEETKP